MVLLALNSLPSKQKSNPNAAQLLLQARKRKREGWDLSGRVHVKISSHSDQSFLKNTYKCIGFFFFGATIVEAIISPAMPVNCLQTVSSFLFPRHIFSILQSFSNFCNAIKINCLEVYICVCIMLMLKQPSFFKKSDTRLCCQAPHNACVFSRHSEPSSWQVFGSTSRYWKAFFFFFFIRRLLDDNRLAWKQMLF